MYTEEKQKSIHIETHRERGRDKNRVVKATTRDI